MVHERWLASRQYFPASAMVRDVDQVPAASSDVPLCTGLPNVIVRPVATPSSDFGVTLI